MKRFLAVFNTTAARLSVPQRLVLVYWDHPERLASLLGLPIADAVSMAAKLDESRFVSVKLTPHGGHLISMEKGVHHAKNEIAVPTRVSGADGCAGPSRSQP